MDFVKGPVVPGEKILYSVSFSIKPGMLSINSVDSI